MVYRTSGLSRLHAWSGRERRTRGNARPSSAIDDKDWNRIATVTIVAHPDLTAEQQSMIVTEYFPGSSARELKVRRCLVGYIIQDLRLATSPEKHKPPEFQLLVSNAERLGDAIWPE